MSPRPKQTGHTLPPREPFIPRFSYLARNPIGIRFYDILILAFLVFMVWCRLLAGVNSWGVGKAGVAG